MAASPTPSLRMPPSRAALVATALLLAACGGDAGPTPPPVPPPPTVNLVPPTISVVGGEAVADTIGALLSRPLVAQVRDSLGRPWAGKEILVRSARSPFESGHVTFRIPGTGEWLPVLVAQSDSLGYVALYVALGDRAGDGAAVLRIGGLAASDTAGYVVQPGAPARVVRLSPDTAVKVGGVVTVRATAVDRVGNPRDDAISVVRTGGAVDFTGGFQLRGREVGVGWAVVGTLWTNDSIAIGVVPEGTITAVSSAACIFVPSEPTSPTCGRPVFEGLVVTDLDGSGYRELVPGAVGFEAPPVWTTDAREIAYVAPVEGRGRLFAVDVATGATRRLVSGAPSWLLYETWGRPTRDGGAVYFSTARNHMYREQWRMRAGADAPERVGPDDFTYTDWRGDPSPDGRTLALVTTRVQYSVRLALLDVATNELRVLPHEGQSPRWSPDGSAIAFARLYDGEIWVIDADGANPRRISPPGRHYAQEVDWSADGRYLIVRGSQYYDLLPLAGGPPIPLPFTRAMSGAAFRR